MKFGYTTHLKNDPTCKDKGGFICKDFKKIYDYMVGIGHNEEYWSMNVINKVAQIAFQETLVEAYVT